MRILRRAAIPAFILLGACGGGTDEERSEPASTRPGNDVPALESETSDRPTEPSPTTPPRSEPDPEPETEPEQAPRPEPETEPGAETEPGQGPDPEPETEPESEPEPEQRPDPEPETEPGSEPEQEPGPESESEPDSRPPVENPSVPDPETQNETSVSFAITVPRYVSNELQVRIVWGEKTLTGVWDGDESWSAVGDFPTDEERLLVVEFLDRNGELPLGTFERDFRTGTNAAETYTVGAGNFDTARWDSDWDGVSNIDELRSGEDPLAEDTPFGLVAGPPSGEEGTPLGVVERVSAFYEASLPKTRPYVESAEALPADAEDFLSFRATRRVNIDIDAAGTGSFSRFLETRSSAEEDIRRLTFEATRTVGDGIDWSGTYAMSVSSAGLSESFTFETETRAVGERISQKGAIEREANLPARQGRTDIEYDLLGERIGGTPRCEPLAGRVVVYERTGLFAYDPGEAPESTTYFKELADQYWNVEVRYEDGSLQGVLRESLGIELYCEFGEL